MPIRAMHGVLMLIAFAANSAIADENILIERVIGPEILTRYKHPASFTELVSGDLYLVYYGGAGEYADDTAVYGARRPKDGERWTRPVVIADTPFRTDGNAVVWQAPDG